MIKIKFILLFSVLFIFFVFNKASASVIINEIQLLPTDARFIELYNNSNSEIDLTGYYIQRKTETGTSFSSLVSSTYFENKKIAGNEYFLISRSAMQGSDIVVSNMTLTESNVIQIKNPEGEVVDKICWGDVSDCTELKASNPAEGKSISRQSNSLVISIPTPGKVNSTSTTEDQTENTSNQSENTGSSSNTNTTSSSSASANKIEEKRIQTKISAKSFGFVGLVNNLEASVTGREGETLFYGRYFWNFGDGSSKEMKVNTGGSATHTYFYPGEYRVILEYYINDYGEIPDATDEIILKIIPADVLISSVGDEKDFFIELTNNTANEVDISKWMLVSNDKRFVFPKNSKIASKKKIILSPFVTGFNILDKSNLKLVNADWKTVFDYGLSITPPPALALVKNVSSVSRARLANSSQDYENDLYVEEDFIENINTDLSNTNLGASVIKSDVKNNYLIYLFLILIIFIGGGMVYFLRKNKNLKTTTEDGDDFDILDE